MSEPLSQPPRRRRRWSSPTLGGLMLLILVVGVFLGWKARRASHQRRAVAAIQAAGGTVIYDSQITGLGYPVYQSFDDSVKLPPARPWGPAWLRRAIGDEYFQEVVGVWLTHGPTPDQPDRGATDEVMRHLANFDRLEMLQINGNGLRLTDAGMAHLRGLTRLRGITIGIVEISDAGLEPLRGMTDLEDLHITNNSSRITSLAPLAGLTRLRSLSLGVTDIDEGELSRLGRMTRLESLHLGRRTPWLTDAGMKHLSTLTSLKYLIMSCSPGLTDAGMADLAKLTALESIALSDTGVTDAGMAYLAALTRLGNLQFTSAKRLTGVGASRLIGLPLKSVEFFSCAVDDAGLEQLGRLAGLENLSVAVNPKVTDAGLKHLRNLDALIYLDIRNNPGISKKGAVALQEQIPILQVHIDQVGYPLPPRRGLGK
jgi:hypothetical protein